MKKKKIKLFGDQNRKQKHSIVLKQSISKLATKMTQFEALWEYYAKWAQLIVTQSTVHCSNMFDISEVATTSVISVLIILELIQRVYNHNHSNTNRVTVLI